MQLLAGRRVMVVEDEALVAMFVEDVLLHAGASVIGPATTVAAALDLLERERPEVAVLDIDLAGETCIPVAEALATRGIPFVVATGYDDAELPPKHTAVPVLARPYNPNDLTAVLNRLCC